MTPRHGNSFAAGGVLIKTKILSYDGSEDNMGSMSVSSRTLCLTLEVANGDI